MTADRFAEVDRDLLADYVGGALDGTPDQVVVDRLIAQHPAWRTAHDELVDASRLVQSTLAEWGSQAEPMPQGVADRITAALAAEPLPAAVPAMVAAPLADRTGTAADHLAPPVEITSATGRDRTRRDGRRRRWQRYATPVAVAAAAAALAGLGLQQLLGGGFTDEASTTAGGAPDSAGGVESAQQEGSPNTMMEPGAPTAPRILASGTDYQRATLAPAVEAAVGRAGEDYTQQSPDDVVLQEEPTPSAALGRFTDQAALADCLASVTAEHGTGALGVGVVDLALFEGAPALVISFTDSAGAAWIWVSGSRCGVPAAGADTRYSTQVG
ncbi:hypothetical protein [Solwaraspora sp. WMMA2101]|uniref:hypothetical protein n=1 Tax=Solwaraspora sp. WMMA2101 TaxID=3404124 RepID=UPI003B946A97